MVRIDERPHIDETRLDLLGGHRRRCPVERDSGVFRSRFPEPQLRDELISSVEDITRDARHQSVIFVQIFLAVFPPLGFHDGGFAICPARSEVMVIDPIAINATEHTMKILAIGAIEGLDHRFALSGHDRAGEVGQCVFANVLGLVVEPQIQRLNKRCRKGHAARMNKGCDYRGHFIPPHTCQRIPRIQRRQHAQVPLGAHRPGIAVTDIDRVGLKLALGLLE